MLSCVNHLSTVSSHAFMGLIVVMGMRSALEAKPVRVSRPISAEHHRRQGEAVVSPDANSSFPAGASEARSLAANTTPAPEEDDSMADQPAHSIVLGPLGWRRHRKRITELTVSTPYHSPHVTIGLSYCSRIARQPPCSPITNAIIII